MLAGGAATNDLGEYRMFDIAAGRYFLKSTPRGERFMGPGAAPETEEYAPVFYPGVSDVRGAVMLDVQPGQTMRGVDMVIQKIPTRRVKGKVVSLVPGKQDSIQFMVVS